MIGHFSRRCNFPCSSQYDEGNIKSRDAALKFNRFRGIRQCSGLTTEDSSVRVIRESALSSLDGRDDYEFACVGSRKSIDTSIAEYKECIFSATLPTGVFVRSSSNTNERDRLSHAFLALSEKFGRGGKLEDVFELFGTFETNKADVLFSDDASQLVTINATPDSIHANLQEYERLKCGPKSHLWSPYEVHLKYNYV